MQRRNWKLFVFVAACAALATVALWFVNEHTEPPPLPPPLPSPLPVPASTLPLAPPPSVAAPQVPADTPRVVVTVRELLPYVAPLRPLCVAHDAVTGAELPVSVVAGAGANPIVAPTRAGLALCAIGLDGDRRLLRQVAIEPANIAEVVPGPRRMVFGLVVDEQQQPVPGARVSLGEIDAANVFREATTNDSGRFELDTPAGDGVPLLVSAPGFASQWRALAVSERGGNEVAITMAGEGILEVQAVGLGLQVSVGRAYVVPSVAVATELASFPFFLQALSRGAELDENGRARVSGLPRVGTIGVLVLHPGSAVPAPVLVRLAGARTLVSVPLQLAPLVSSRIVDERGEPVAFATVVWRPHARAVPASASLRLLPPLLDAVACTVAFGDATGAFGLGVPANEEGLLSLRAPGHAGRDLSPMPRLGQSPLVLPRWVGGEPSLRVASPVAMGPWVSEWNLAGGLRLVHTDATPATVALPNAGRFEVELTTFVGERNCGSSKFESLDATGVVLLPAPPVAAAAGR